MTDSLLQLGLSNVLISLILAIIAMLMGTIIKRPNFLYILWLIVLVKLVTPPVVTIPVLSIPEQKEITVTSIQSHAVEIPRMSLYKEDVYRSVEAWFTSLARGKQEFSLLWLLGSVIVFGVSLARIYRFNRLLRDESEIAPQGVQTAAARIAMRLDMKTVPAIYVTSAHLSPMVWWVGGDIRIVLPVVLYEQMDFHQFQLILAHELAHLRRRDYLVRWIEWLACVGFWWNPVVWWARQNLRANEELCCDALVVSSLQLKSQTYAYSLLKAVEFIASPVLRPPAMASEINSGGFLKRRFRMIVSGNLMQSNSRWWQACVLLCALVVLPLGFACNSDIVATSPLEQTEDAAMKTTTVQLEGLTEIDQSIRAADENGELTPEESSEIMSEQRYLEGVIIKQEIKINAIKKELDRLIESGEITRLMAEARLEAIEQEREQIDERDGTDRQAERIHYEQVDLEAVLQELNTAVKSGSLTREQADTRIEAMEHELWEVSQRDGMGQHREGVHVERKIALDVLLHELEAAIESGKITREQADTELEALR